MMFIRYIGAATNSQARILQCISDFFFLKRVYLNQYTTHLDEKNLDTPGTGSKTYQKVSTQVRLLIFISTLSHNPKSINDLQIH